MASTKLDRYGSIPADTFGSSQQLTAGMPRNRTQIGRAVDGRRVPRAGSPDNLAGLQAPSAKYDLKPVRRARPMLLGLALTTDIRASSQAENRR